MHISVFLIYKCTLYFGISFQLTVICIEWHCCSVTKSRPTLQPHGLQLARLPCPSLSLRVCSNSSPLSQGSHPASSSSVTPFTFQKLSTETPILWPPHAKSWLTGKDPDAGRDLGQEEKGTTEDEMAGWHHWLDGHKFKSGNWWWTRRPGMLWFMGLQRVGHDWATELTWTEHFKMYEQLKHISRYRVKKDF